MNDESIISTAFQRPPSHFPPRRKSILLSRQNVSFVSVWNRELGEHGTLTLLGQYLYFCKVMDAMKVRVLENTLHGWLVSMDLDLGGHACVIGSAGLFFPPLLEEWYTVHFLIN